jgi:pyridoxamine 5'-phosphate oxidase
VSDEEADAYFATRPRLSQISAWTSKQSQPMQGYFELEAEVAKAALRFGIGKIPRPPFWSGFRVVPERIEFWTGKPFRRHHRIVYERARDGWRKTVALPIVIKTLRNNCTAKRNCGTSAHAAATMIWQITMRLD